MSVVVKPNDAERGLLCVKSTLPTLGERESLQECLTPRLSAFTTRPSERLVKLKKSTSTLDIECRQFVRSAPGRLPHIDPNLQYTLWLEAGKHNPPFPNDHDRNYNSNVWRNFRKNYGFVTEADDCSISEVIAAIYPLNIPSPSKVGDHTFYRYIAETRLFEQPKYRSIALQRTKTDMAEFLRLKLRSEQRNPRLDHKGNILPPENFKRYIHKCIPQPKPETPDDGVYKIDMFGQIARSKPEASLWKLSHKLNHPAYQKLRENLQQRKELQKQMAEINGSRKLSIEWGRRLQEPCPI